MAACRNAAGWCDRIERKDVRRGTAKSLRLIKGAGDRITADWSPLQLVPRLRPGTPYLRGARLASRVSGQALSRGMR